MHWREIIHSGWRHDRPWVWLVILTGVVNAGTWAAMIALGRGQQNLVPLHYTIYFGPDLTTTPARLLWLPAFGAWVWVVHAAIALSRDHSLWRRSWGVIGFVLNFILLAVTAALWYSSRIGL